MKKTYGFNFNPICTFQDMARTDNSYKQWLRGDTTVNIQGRSMVLAFCPSPHCHLSIPSLFKMSTVVLKLFAGQGTGRTDGQSGDYIPFGEHKMRGLLIKLHGRNQIITRV